MMYCTVKIIDYLIIQIICSLAGDGMFQNNTSSDTWIASTSTAGGPAACPPLNPAHFPPHLLAGAPPISSQSTNTVNQPQSNIVYNDSKLHQIPIPSIPLNQISIPNIPINQIPIPSIPITSGVCFSVPSTIATSSFNTFPSGVQFINPVSTYPFHQMVSLQHQTLSVSGHTYPMFLDQALSAPHIYANNITLSHDPLMSISSTCSSSHVPLNQNKKFDSKLSDTSQNKNSNT